MDQGQYEGMSQFLEPKVRQWPGFVAHIGGPTEGGWYIMEVWESKDAWQKFMQEEVAPAMQGAPTPSIEEFQVHKRVARG